MVEVKVMTSGLAEERIIVEKICIDRCQLCSL